MLSGMLKCMSDKLGWNVSKIFAFSFPIIDSGWSYARLQWRLSPFYVSFEDIDIAASIQHALICHPLVVFKQLIIVDAIRWIRRDVKMDVSRDVIECPYICRMR